MNKYPVFPHAPIKEALLDIRVELPKETSLKDLQSIYDSIKERFSEKKQKMSYEGGFKMLEKGGTETLPTSGKPDGYLFRCPGENKIVQSRLDGFTFNKLKPYEDWEKFRDEAHSLWDKYFEIAKPAKIIRLGLRYINEIEMPLPMKNFREYILTIPVIAPKLPQSLSGFFMQLTVLNHDIDAEAIITETIKRPTANKKLPFILDIDVFRNTDYNENKSEIWDEFEKLRAFKNDIFINSITEKTKELFK